MDRVLNARIRELCRVMNWVDEKIDESVLCWYGRAERMKNGRIAKLCVCERVGG